MSPLKDPRVRNTLVQFFRFGLIGGLGVLVNQGILIAANVIGREWLHVGASDVLFRILNTRYNVRNFNLYYVLAFLGANLFNFVLNRYWTFRHGTRAPFWKEYWPFLVVGAAAAAVGLVLLNLLMHPDSLIGLPNSVFDNSSGLRTKLYWANLIVIALVTPINFVFNKLWTFRHVRRKHAASLADERALDEPTPPEGGPVTEPGPAS